MSSLVWIERIRLLEIELPLAIPFQISGGVMRTRRSLIVEFHSAGATGYGEAAPFEQPFYSSETFGSALALCKDLLIERIEGKSFAGIEEFNDALKLGVRGNPFARCGFENAFWDLMAATRRKTLQDLIVEEMERLHVAPAYRQPAPRVASGAAVGIPESGDLLELREWIARYRDEGYQRVKIKIRPGWDAEPFAAARETLGPDFMLWGDANASYDLAHHADALKRLDQFKTPFIEQPLHHDDLLDHARLGRTIRTPICLDESLKDARVARQAIECEASRIWNIKVQRMGGLLEAIKVYAVAAKNGVRLWGGTMPESGIGAQAILALAAFPLFAFPADIEPSRRWYPPGTDPLEIAMDEGGWIKVPAACGIGSLIDQERYKKIAKPLRD